VTKLILGSISTFFTYCQFDKHILFKNIIDIFIYM